MSAVARRTTGKTSTKTPARAGNLRRDIGRIGLMFTSVGSVIGSGWLLGALNATQIAGPAAISPGSSARRRSCCSLLSTPNSAACTTSTAASCASPHYAFGSLVGFGMGWVYWLGSVTLAPVETEAALHYGDKWVNQAFSFHLVQLQKSSSHAVGSPAPATRSPPC